MTLFSFLNFMYLNWGVSEYTFLYTSMVDGKFLFLHMKKKKREKLSDLQIFEHYIV